MSLIKSLEEIQSDISWENLDDYFIDALSEKLNPSWGPFAFEIIID
jgi:hypothetical protein